MEKKFKIFDRVLTKYGKVWVADIYSNYIEENKLHLTLRGTFYGTDILPYEGNEELVGINLDGTHTEKTWSEQLYELFKQAYEIADTWSNPLRNDAGGSMCCEYVKQDMDKWIKYFESWASQK